MKTGACVRPSAFAKATARQAKQSKIGDLKFEKRPMKSPMPDWPSKLNQIKPD
jgi:hypothetical protein